MILSATLFLLGVFAYSLKELKSFNKLKWMKDDDSFWGEESHYRKYANPLDAPKNNWYYKFFKIGYRERFPGSATVFVFTTDGAHLMQFFYKLLFCSAFYPLTNPIAIGWWFAVILWIVWSTTFTLCDKYLTK